MPNFGHTTQGATHATAMNSDTKFSLRVVAPEDGTVTAIYADIENSGTEIQALRAGIYNDAASMSGANLLDQSDPILVSPGATRGFFAFNSGLRVPIVGGSVYWLTLHSGTTGGNASFWYDANVGSQLVATDSFADGLSSTYGTVSLTQSNSVALYAEYTAVSLQNRGLSKVVFSKRAVFA